MKYIKLQKPAICFALMLLMLTSLNTKTFAEYGEFGARVSLGFGFGDQVGLDSLKIGLGIDEILGLDVTLGSVLLFLYQYSYVGASLDLYPLKFIVVQNRVQMFVARGNYQYAAYGVALGLRGLKFGELTVQLVAGYSLFRTHKEIDEPFGFFFELTLTGFLPFTSD